MSVCYHLSQINIQELKISLQSEDNAHKLSLCKDCDRDILDKSSTGISTPSQMTNSDKA